MTDVVEALHTERNETHGDFKYQFACAQDLKYMFNKWCDKKRLHVVQVETLDMVATKLSRILTGDPNFADHWYDAGAYMVLGGKVCSK